MFILFLDESHAFLSPKKIIIWHYHPPKSLVLSHKLLSDLMDGKRLRVWDGGDRMHRNSGLSTCQDHRQQQGTPQTHKSKAWLTCYMWCQSLDTRWDKPGIIASLRDRHTSLSNARNSMSFLLGEKFPRKKFKKK